MKTKKVKPMKKKTVKKKDKIPTSNPAYQAIFQMPEFSPYKVGQAYMFVTVTRYYTGKLKWVGDKELVITEAAWIAHTDRYNAALTTGVVRSVEPIPGEVIIGRGSIIEVAEWNHALPAQVK